MKNTPPAKIPRWTSYAYSPNAVKELQKIDLSSRNTENSIEAFYQSLVDLPNAGEILHRLNNQECGNLKKAHHDYLLTLMQPTLTAEEHAQKALRLGHTHFYVGLPSDLLIEAYALYSHAIDHTTENLENKIVVREILKYRIQWDLMLQIKAYTQAKQTMTSMHKKMLQLQYSTEKIGMRKSLTFLTEAMSDCITGLAIGRTEHESFIPTAAAGEISIDGIEHSYIHIPGVQNAWYQEEAYIQNSMNDQCFEALKNEIFGARCRSFAFFIIKTPKRAPTAMLLVTSQYPGYFSNPSIVHFWNQICNLYGNKLYLASSASGIERDFAKETHYRQLLIKKEVTVLYQPIIDPSTGRTVKVEALARLKDNDTLISPKVFLVAFGEVQLRNLFEIVLEKAMLDLSKIPGKRPMCSINLPPEALADPVWLENLLNLLIAHQANPQNLSLEILESSLQDNQETIHELSLLHEMGYEIVLDDVGAGESSLVRMMDLPITGIKIDQNFVRSLQNTFDALDLILSLRFIALERGLECTAEGIQDNKIIDIFCSLNGNKPLLQGYAFAEPMSLEALKNGWKTTSIVNLCMTPLKRWQAGMQAISNDSSA